VVNDSVSPIPTHHAVSTLSTSSPPLSETIPLQLPLHHSSSTAHHIIPPAASRDNQSDPSSALSHVTLREVLHLPSLVFIFPRLKGTGLASSAYFYQSRGGKIILAGRQASKQAGRTHVRSARPPTDMLLTQRRTSPRNPNVFPTAQLFLLGMFRRLQKKRISAATYTTSTDIRILTTTNNSIGARC
jgi:hypothetical protein